MSQDLILAHIIQGKLADSTDLDVLTFVDIGDDGGFIDTVRTYGDLWNNGQRIASALQAEGMAPGDAFGLLMLNHAEFVDTMVGSSIAATVFVPIDPRTKSAKLAYMLDFAECRGVIVADYALPNLVAEMPNLPRLEWVWILDTGLALDSLETVRCRRMSDVFDRAVPQLQILSNDPLAPMQMLYTSGTTGDPKAIRSPHARFGSVGSLGPVIGLTEEDRPYTGLSLTHANAQLITLGNVLKMGLRGVISLKFTKSRLWDICRHYGCTMFNLLGGMTTAIYADPQRPDDADNPVRYVFSAGMPAAIWTDFQDRFGVEIYEFYGCAEGGLTLNPPGLGPIGSIGKAPPDSQCSIRDEDDNAVTVGASGEICFRNADGSCPQVEYFKNPAASEKKTVGGWFRTGDIGHMDAAGYLFFEYRAGGGIRRNGDFVNPAFVEKAIAESAGVADVFVYGIPLSHNAPGEKEVVAAIVVEPGAFDVEATINACRKKLEASSVPGFFQLVEEIPKTASEKPQERFLIDDFDVRASNVIEI